MKKYLFLLVISTLILSSPVFAREEIKNKSTNLDTQELNLIKAGSEEQEQGIQQAKIETPNAAPTNPEAFDPVKYTLGPDDVIQIDVRRHPEFSATFPINLEGKIQYKFVGDIVVSGFTKDELKEKLKGILSEYVIDPDIDITIQEYRSKVIYVIGEVGAPGKYYMRADSIPVREALVAAGLPTLASAMRRTRLVTPDEKGKPQYKVVDLFKLLYEGDLKINLEMKPGDILYVPATVMAKIMHVINPIAGVIGGGNTVESAVTRGTVGR